MKITLATLLALASASVAAATPNASYKSMTDQAAADYKAASAKCDAQSGNAKTICLDEAKATRARTLAEAVSLYRNNKNERIKADIAVADADFDVSRARCMDMAGSDKDNCLAEAKRTHATAIADARNEKTIHEKAGSTATTTTPVTSPTAERAGEATAVAVQKTENAANSVAEKSREATAKSGEVASDSMITTKVKADLFKEPDLKSLAIHVETDHGVVKLSGFVNSANEAQRAVDVARNVKGVTDVQSAIKVK